MSFHDQPATYIREVSLLVKNIERSISFYHESLGLQILEQTDQYAVLSANGSTPLIRLEMPDYVSEKQPRTTGLYHFALLLPNRTELGKLLQHLIDQRYPLQGASDHLVSEAVYLSDPDNNGIEIYTDRPPSEWEWEDGHVKMSVDPLDGDGILAEAKGHEWTGISPQTVMGHIHIQVANLNDSQIFYCDGLGFDVVSRFGNQALFISTNSYHHHIGLNTWAGTDALPPAKNSTGIHWFEVVYPSLKKRQIVLDRLKKLGAVVEQIEDYFFTVDPSGNRVKLVVG
ncbi:glyoxalase [Salipaludibacillus keqinensis]|uniref:Glyoxalase n=1 Tax=Salipaludibacillus keqinensis TaxID=2045207 RepID=A0A323T843_9BACI|nr:VOC family protein [Salipaludibacillus keqinensis]PYZ92032.1 glyoxalase [Salipaludibacillus keqinensis]